MSNSNRCLEAEAGGPAEDVEIPIVSVVTPVHRSALRYLVDAHGSLCEQNLPGWEWVVQFDGAERRWPRWMLDDERVRPAVNGVELGSPRTRNRAFLRARAPLVQTLDADDWLLPGALRALAGAFERPEVAYAFGRAVDELPDGQRRHFQMPFEPGLVAPGRVFHELSAAGRFRVHCAEIMWRRECLFAWGGYAGLPGSADEALLLGMSKMEAGYYVDRDTFLYRRHSRQTTKSAAYLDLDHLNEEFGRHRARAVRAHASVERVGLIPMFRL